MGSLSGTKAPARRPLPSSVEPSHSIKLRLNDFWDNTIIPLLDHLPSNVDSIPNEPVPDTNTIDSSSSHTSSAPPLQPAILLVSHGATISQLIHNVLLHGHGYTATCDVSRRGIYNTSISIFRLQVDQKSERNEPTMDAETEAEDVPLSVSGELIVYASIAHIIQSKGKKVVKENADMLEQRSS
ncbi:hypothetical protein BDV93DRAFT_521732 [Ceratobasidium sp. AG-I]|nr:hypothetical protein BDV93DRAFT_521732 [Ceratobasidium sp. AG-I]